VSVISGHESLGGLLPDVIDATGARRRIVPKGQQDSPQGFNPGNTANKTEPPQRATDLEIARSITFENARPILAPLQGASLEGQAPQG
jgi:hypothetical protein